MQRHTKSHLEDRKRRNLTVGIRWLESRSLYTTNRTAQIFWGVVLNDSSQPCTRLEDFEFQN